ncbi:murein biosynthesis integral membrane protein MurJ [Deinococcus ficus]|uniref:Murein biosynthesis integral membrane protein MurJ n=2 Tax=Deinococcus ficus TaxID=317577 RepID=A0A221SX67_9DEIO|nr:murein biosynthesis integral membrane protein MurJ [Deinococcus ficus]
MTDARSGAPAPLPEIDLEFPDPAVTGAVPAEPDPAPHLGPAQPAPAAPKGRSLRANTLIVMAGTLASRLSGIVRTQVLNLADNTLLDAFMVAIRVPNLLRELLAEGALVNSFIPVYKSLNAEDRRRMASAFSGLLIAVNLILLAVGILAAPWIVEAFIAADSNVDREVATYMTQLVMPFLMLISLSSIAMGVLNADEHFRESSFAPVAFNIASIVALLLLPKTATWLAFGWLIGGVAQLLVQLPALRRFGLLPAPGLSGHPAVGRVLRQMAPFTMTAGARQFLNLVVQNMLTNRALGFGAGTSAGYGVAEALFTTVNGLFVVSPVMAMFPRFAQHAAEKNWTAFRTLTAQGLRTTTFLTAPMSALLLALAPYAVSVINLSPNYDLARFAAATGILQGWALALLPWAVVTLLLRTFYARERTREAVTISAIGFVVEVAFYHLLVPRLGFRGFGLSTAISGTLMALALVWRYRAALGFPGREVLGHLLRVTGLAAIAGVVSWIAVNLLPFQPGFILPGVAGLAVAGTLGLGTYLVLAVILRLPEVNGVLRRLKR